MRSTVRFAVFVASLLASVCAHAQIELGDAQRENLGPAINSTSVEILPIVSADGSTLYFDRKFDARNVGGVDDEDDIYFSTRQPDGTWSAAQNIGAPLNTPGSDVLYWISADGNTALVHHGGARGAAPAGMAIARRRNGTWTKPTPIRIAGVAALGQSYYAYLSPNGGHLLLSYPPDPNRPGDLDIFVCEAIGDDMLRWGAPRSLGRTINTVGFDGAPYLASDERTLYFTSDGHGGMGSTDLLVARRLDTSWTNWSAPVNLGGTVNTPRFDASLSIPADGRHIYLSGAGYVDETTYGKSDIFRIPLPEQYRPAVVLSVHGRLVAGTRGVTGLVRAERMPERTEVATTVSDAAGNFAFTLPAGVEYRLTGGADGYNEGTAAVDARELNVSQRVTPTIRLTEIPRAVAQPEPEPAEIGIYFASGSAELTSRALAGLERALATLQRDQRSGAVSAIAIIGHTDDVGEEDANVELSRRRAEAVRGWLAGRGIDAALMSIEPLGESRPRASNATATGRATNRRVDVEYSVERLVAPDRGN